MRKRIGLRGERYAGNHFDCRFDFDAGGRSTEMASQPGLGLFSERRSGARPSHPDRLDTFRSALDSEAAAISRTCDGHKRLDEHVLPQILP